MLIWCSICIVAQLSIIVLLISILKQFLLLYLLLVCYSNIVIVIGVNGLSTGKSDLYFFFKHKYENS